jgi:hypothetical protein
MTAIDVSPPEEYYPEFEYLCRSCTSDDVDSGDGVETDGGLNQQSTGECTQKLVKPDGGAAAEERETAYKRRIRGEAIGRAWGQSAHENEDEWGVQHPEELLSAIVEEVGEIEQAYLEATHEGADPAAVETEIDDLGPLLMQLVHSCRTHPMAFEPLPTAGEDRSEHTSIEGSDNAE